MIHPITIKGLEPSNLAQILNKEDTKVQSLFFRLLSDNLRFQAYGDEKRTYFKIANDMLNATAHLDTFANQLYDNLNYIQFPSIICSLAKDVGALRYDAMIIFIDAYSKISNSLSLFDAGYCVKEAWKHTPLSWKEKYASDRLF